MDIIIYAVGIEGRQSKLQIDDRHDAKVFWLLGCTVVSQVRSVYKGARTYPAGRPEQYRTNNSPYELDTALAIIFKQDTKRANKWKDIYGRYIK